MATKTIAIEVPEERVASFYALFGRWLGAIDAVVVPSSYLQRRREVAWSQTDDALMKDLREDLLSAPALDELINTLVDQPDVPVPWRALAARCGAGSIAGVAQLVADLAARCQSSGRHMFVSWHDAGDGPAYWVPSTIAGLWLRSDPVAITEEAAHEGDPDDPATDPAPVVTGRT